MSGPVVGGVYGRWTVVGESFTRPDRRFNRYVPCRCVCGNERSVSWADLRASNSTGCRSCQIRERNTTHGHSPRSGASPEYAVYKKMVERCLSENSTSFAKYGAAGRTVAPEWLGGGGFERWLSHVGARPSRYHSIDRIDNTLGYEPGNLKWSTPVEQGRNRGVSVWLTYRGVRRHVVEWCELLGMNVETARWRVRQGWTPEEVFETPVRRRRAL